MWIPTQVVALLGAHSLGGAHRTSSGYSGRWNSGRNPGLNELLYLNMINKTNIWTNVVWHLFKTAFYLLPNLLMCTAPIYLMSLLPTEFMFHLQIRFFLMTKNICFQPKNLIACKSTNLIIWQQLKQQIRLRIIEHLKNLKVSDKIFKFLTSMAYLCLNKFQSTVI